MSSGGVPVDHVGALPPADSGFISSGTHRKPPWGCTASVAGLPGNANERRGRAAQRGPVPRPCHEPP